MQDLEQYVKNEEILILSEILEKLENSQSDLEQSFMQIIDLAMKLKKIEVIRQIISERPNLVNCTNAMGETPLILSVIHDFPDAFDCILNYNPDIKVQSYLWGTVLTAAIFKEQDQRAHRLLSIEGPFDTTAHPGALLWAIKKEKIDLVKEMCARGADLNLTSDENLIEIDEPLWQFASGNTTPFNLDPNHFVFDYPINQALEQRQYPILRELLRYNPDFHIEGYLEETFMDKLDEVDNLPADIQQSIEMIRRGRFHDEFFLSLEETVNGYVHSAILDNSTDNQRLLTTLLLNPTLSPVIAGEVGYMLDESIFESMKILYVFFYPEKIDLDEMQQFKQMMLKEIVERSFSDKDKNNESITLRLTWVLNHTQLLILKALTASNLIEDAEKSIEENNRLLIKYINAAQEKSRDEIVQDRNSLLFTDIQNTQSAGESVVPNLLHHGIFQHQYETPSIETQPDNRKMSITRK